MKKKIIWRRVPAVVIGEIVWVFHALFDGWRETNYFAQRKKKKLEQYENICRRTDMEERDKE